MAEKKNPNMEIYDSHREPPKDALKPISAGRLKGMTDINPMWRIKALTEQFGACGIGWYYIVDEQRIEDCGNERVAIVNISLFIRVNDEWSKPIHGTGGSKLITMESKGAYVSDEAFKMATTDALSVACKQLGFAADIYWSTDRDKYTANDTPEKKQNTNEEVLTKEEQEKKNKEMVDSVDQRYVPNPKRTKEEMKANIWEEMKRTGINEKSTLATMGIKEWSEITDAKYITIMNKFKKQPTKESK
jgi:hypothetical protein